FFSGMKPEIMIQQMIGGVKPAALIAVPMTVSILIICSRFEPLRPLALLLSSSPNFERLDERTRHT
ncbi:MAG: hypothetical protein R3349_01770, partial [Geminicoccaceae bacterium]|nr:hypothetical protein [Geminicoccaceae bacterium]